ncbi:MAG: GNAT family N-acetyltransferase [Gammaproteobacteria bacterium]|nr:GNAT family N-acetyltransferase [Gammaproteobacteria bacterium]
MPLIIRSPERPQEWRDYFELRWKILRQPWQQPRGSEKDELEDSSIHRIALYKNRLVAVARMHFTDEAKAQIRYMAVDADFRHRGIGVKLLASLELAAKQNNIGHIELNAREGAVKFYQSRHYIVIKPADTLFNQIKHFKMEKKL